MLGRLLTFFVLVSIVLLGPVVAFVGVESGLIAPFLADGNGPQGTGGAASAANPYGTETLVVGVDDARADRDVEPLLEEALQYWETHSETYAGYPISYDLRPDARDPDVTITWRESLSVCGYQVESRTLGCAPVVTGDAPDVVEIEVEAGRGPETTRQVLKHELGHTLGLDHDDEPQDVMRGTVGR